MMQISIQYLVKLVKASTKSGEHDHVSNFYSRLDTYMDKASKKIADEVYKDKTDLGMMEFFERLTTGQSLHNILTTRALRTYVQKVHDDTPVQEKGNTAAVLDMFAAFQ